MRMASASTQAAEVGRRLELAAVPQRGHPLRGDMPDVALPGLEPLDLGRIHIEAQDREALPANSSTSGSPT